MSFKPAPAKISLALGTKKAPASKPKPKVTTGAKRGRTTFDDSDHEDEGATETRVITSFSGGKAIDENAPAIVKRIRVIAPPPELKEGDWLERAMKKRQKGPLPSREQPGDTSKDVVNAEEISYGLNLAPKKDDEDLLFAVSTSNGDVAVPVLKTDDELALEALIEGRSDSDRVISTVANEKEAFQQAYETAPDMASIADYEATPIEGFGAALLRGMGWKDGESIGRKRDGPVVKPRVLERRPALLGIGAKPEDATGVELGAWGKADKSRKGRQQQSYVPVILKNKRTGEEITEEALKARQERGKLVENAPESRGAKSKSPERKQIEYKDRFPGRDQDYGSSRDRREKYSDRGRERDSRKDLDRNDDRANDRYRVRDRERDDNYSSNTRTRSTSSSRYRKRRRDDDDYDSHRSSRKERRKDDDYDTRGEMKSDRSWYREKERDRDRDHRRRDDDDRYHRNRNMERDRERR